jgi:RF-1 domain
VSGHPASLPLEELLAQCQIERTRRGGPGGQHRNKVETAIVLRHVPTGAIGQASERRSQDLNRQAALERLRVALALEIRGPIAHDAPTSSLWRTRSKRGKLAVSGQHEDYPAMLAEALDRLASCDWDLAAAAERLAVTSSQLIKFLKVEPAAFTLLNQQRAERGLLRLK